MSRTLLLSSITSCAGGAVILACIPDPKGEYQDYQDRTAHLAPGSSGGAVDASFDSKPPEEAVDQLYVAICVTSLALRNPEQALRFYTETSFVPNDSGGTLKLSLTPIRGWSYEPPPGAYVPPSKLTVSKTDTRGDAVTAEMPVTTEGSFIANLGTIDLVGEANSVSGSPAKIENVTLAGRFGAGDRFCSTLAGDLTLPYNAKLAPDKNTCLFIKAKEGDKLPVLEQAEFVCSP